MEPREVLKIIIMGTSSSGDEVDIILSILPAK